MSTIGLAIVAAKRWCFCSPSQTDDLGGISATRLTSLDNNGAPAGGTHSTLGHACEAGGSGLGGAAGAHRHLAGAHCGSHCEVCEVCGVITTTDNCCGARERVELWAGELGEVAGK